MPKLMTKSGQHRHYGTSCWRCDDRRRWRHRRFCWKNIDMGAFSDDNDELIILNVL